MSSRSLASLSVGGAPTVSTMGNPEIVANINATVQNLEVTTLIRRLQDEIAQLRANMSQTQVSQNVAPQNQTNVPFQQTFFTPQPGRSRRRRGPRGRQTRQQRGQGGEQMQQAQQTQTIPLTQQNSWRNQTGIFVPKYCWTHGLCRHCSCNCFLPAPNHQRAATLQNRMGGSTYDYSHPWRLGCRKIDTVTFKHVVTGNPVNSQLTRIVDGKGPNNCVLNTQPKTTCIAKADTGASTHYWRPQDKKFLMDIHNKTGPLITLPYGSALNATEVGYLPISKQISPKGRKTQIVLQLQSSSLISVEALEGKLFCISSAIL